MSQLSEGGFVGLTQQEAENRLRTYGPNLVSAGKKRSRASMLLSYFKSPLVIILVFADTISAFHWNRSGNTVMGFD